MALRVELRQERRQIDRLHGQIEMIGRGHLRRLPGHVEFGDGGVDGEIDLRQRQPVAAQRHGGVLLLRGKAPGLIVEVEPHAGFAGLDAQGHRALLRRAQLKGMEAGGGPPGAGHGDAARPRGLG